MQNQHLKTEKQNKAILKQVKSTEKQIKNLQVKAKKMMDAVQQYKENKSGQSAYAYIQFESMNGYKKFKNAMDINWLKRFYMR